MYHLHTKKSSLDFETYNFVLNQNYGSEIEKSAAQTKRLREIADQSFDLLSQIQKMDKLSKLGHLSTAEQSSFKSQIRLVGILIHTLKQYGYNDNEMMIALVNRFNKFEKQAEKEAAG